MNEEQYREFGQIAQQCSGDDRRYRSINVASKVRSDAILAAWRELERLRDVNHDLAVACEALLDAFEGYEMLAALDANVQEQARIAIAKGQTDAERT